MTLTLGLNSQLDSPRVASASEPYPNRWTHRIPVSQASEIDEELISWLREAYYFNESKR